MDNSAIIIDATTEIFSTMIMLEAVPHPPQLERDPTFCCNVSGMIGLAGLYKGMLAIHASTEVALAITGSFLGMDVSEVDSEVCDAIGELANMLGGSIKHQLSAQGADIKLSIPSTICGRDYRVDCGASGQSQIIPFGIPAGTFLVELQIEKQA